MMRNTIIYISFIILLFLPIVTVKGINIDNSFSTGLTFRSHEVNKDERTSLNLTPLKPIRLSKGLTLEFDLKIRYASHSYGYIFRVIANDTASLDMTTDIGTNKINVILNDMREAKATSELRFERKEIENKWTKVIVNISADTIKYILDGKETIINSSFENIKEWKIFFGANRHEHFYTTDVPPIAIKNLKIRDNKGKVVRDWSMSVHGDNIVYDHIDNYQASVINGIWELDKHTEWKETGSLTTMQKRTQIAYDSINARVFAVSKDSLYIIHVRTKKIEKIKVEEGRPFTEAASHLIYDYKNKQLISYSIDQTQFIIYDFSTNKWLGERISESIKIQHHNKFINPERDELVLFGGYGYYKYSAVLATHGLSAGDWNYTDLIEEVTPRYLASMGYLGEDKVLVFGGYGSTTGIQAESARNLYDLHEIDTHNKSTIKIGELSGIQDHLAFSNSMVINKQQQKLYTLSFHNDVYKTHINLLEIDMTDMSHRLLADSIPYNFHDTESYCDVFLYKDSYLYAIVLYKQDNGLYNIKTYSLMYPPLAKSDVIQTDIKEKGISVPFIILLAGLLLLILVIFIYLYKRKEKQITEKKEQILTEGTSIAPPEKGFPKKDTKSSIALFGGFQVFDKQDKDITSNFTPVIRQMFLMILLESITTGKGITSERLVDALWFDMDKTKATNNRNVNISKLRLLLHEVGDIKLQKNGNYWQINIGDDVFCDYTQIIALLNEIKKTGKANKSSIGQIIDITSAGALLPNIDAEWVDKYKSGYSSLLIEILLKFSVQKDIQEDLRLLVKLADVILLHDNIDEDSIKIKCRSLYKLGQKGLSKQCYDKFYTDHINILNEEPTLKYETIIVSEE